MCLGDDGLCYLENAVVKNYLNLPSTRSLLGVESPHNFSACSNIVGGNFVAHMDQWKTPAQYYVAGLLDRGLRILLYAGTYDWQCNWVQNKMWIDKLEWAGKDMYRKAEWRSWYSKGKIVGETKKAGVLTFATIRGAGHMVSLPLPVSLV